jgi:hypothetical protein
MSSAAATYHSTAAEDHQRGAETPPPPMSPSSGVNFPEVRLSPLDDLQRVFKPGSYVFGITLSMQILLQD